MIRRTRSSVNIVAMKRLNFEIPARSRLADSRRSVARLRQIGGRQIEQVRELSHQVAFMTADLAVREYDAPHHLRQDHSLAQVIMLGDDAGELEVIDGFPSLGLSEFYQLVGSGRVHTEVTAKR